MAKTSSPLMQLVSGMLGKEIVFKQYYDKTVISKKPDMSKRVLSERQIDWNWRMKLANGYAKHIYSNKEDRIKERIRLSLPPHKSLYHALVQEHLNKHKDTPVDEVHL